MAITHTYEFYVPFLQSIHIAHFPSEQFHPIRRLMKPNDILGCARFCVRVFCDVKSVDDEKSAYA